MPEIQSGVEKPKNDSLIVWLRGDEDDFAEFSMDPDSVMRELGIKRSRLTQISGKQLPVGRARVGRYVRPFYRPKDVKAYKESLRPTVSHQKSSDLVKGAANQLQEATESLTEQLTQDLQNLPRQVEKVLRDQSFSEASLAARLDSRTTREISRLCQRVLARHEQSASRVEAMMERLRDDVQNAVESAKNQRSELFEKLKTIDSQIEKPLSDLGSKVRSVHEIFQERLDALEKSVELRAEETQDLMVRYFEAARMLADDQQDGLDVHINRLHQRFNAVEMRFHQELSKMKEKPKNKSSRPVRVAPVRLRSKP